MLKTEMKTLKDVMEGLKVIGAGTATIALAGAAVGIGKIDSSLIHSLARSPELDTSLFGYAILGFALTEAIALFALMMAFLISFVFRSSKVKFLPALVK
jgi:F-type H+-transporting ATPase subunit c